MFKKITTVITLAFFLWGGIYPSWAIAAANPMGLGQDFGLSIMPPASMGTMDGSNTALQMSPPNSTPVSINIQELFPDHGAGTDANFDSLYENEDAITSEVSNTTTRLGEEQSMTGEAFRTVFSGVQSSRRPDLRNDPIWGQTDANLQNVFDGNFSDCVRTTTVDSTTSSVHIPGYQRCERLPKTPTCEVERIVTQVEYTPRPQCTPGQTLFSVAGRKADYQYVCSADGKHHQIKGDGYLHPPLFPLAESYTLTQAGGTWYADCKDVGVDRVCTYWGGSHKRYHGKIDFTFHNYEPESLVHDEIIKYFPPGCNNSDSFCQVDDSQWQCTQVDNGRVINGVKLTPEIAELGFSPLYPTDNQADVCWKASVPRTCDYNVGQMDCWTDIYGNEQCPYNEGDRLSSCEEYENDPGCAFIKSECVKGATGETGACYVWEDTYDCGENAGITESTLQETYNCDGDYICPGGNCVEGDGQNNTSFNKAVAHLQAAQFAMEDMKCDETGSVCSVFGGSNYQCKIAVGGWQDCCDQPAQASIQSYMDMLSASSRLMSSRQSLMESSAEGINWGSWTTMGSAVSSGLANAGDYYRIINGICTGDWESAAAGAGKMIVKAVAKEVAKEAAQSVVGQMVKEKLKQWATKIIGSAMNLLGIGAGAGGQTANLAVQKAMDTAASFIGGVVSIVGWVYLIYQIANLVVQMVYKCEEEEFELATKQAMKVCHFVGSYCASEVLGACLEKRESYCCYESPLSRIIMEQAKKQLGGTSSSFGDPEFPNCEGLTMLELGTLDWDQIDMSEWMGLLATSGHLPSATDYKLDMESMTGAPSSLNLSDDSSIASSIEPYLAPGETYTSSVPSEVSAGEITLDNPPRANVLERTQGRLADEFSLSDTNEEIRQGMYDIAPNLLAQ